MEKLQIQEINTTPLEYWLGALIMITLLEIIIIFMKL